MKPTERTMRAVLILSLVAALGGCSSARQALGLYQKTADKGVTLGGGKPGAGFAPPGSAATDADPAPARSEVASAKASKQALPTGLGGDKEHRAYTSDAPH